MTLYIDPLAPFMPGPDVISNELLKYATSILSEPFPEIISTIFTYYLNTLIALYRSTRRILIALPKPGKPQRLLTKDSTQ